MLKKSYLTAKYAKPSFAITSEGKKKRKARKVKTLMSYPLRSLRIPFATFAVNGFNLKFAGLLYPESKMVYKLSKNRKIDSVEPLCRKKTYNSPEEAQEMIRQIMETRVARAIHFYQCPVCGLWHLTSRREK